MPSNVEIKARVRDFGALSARTGRLSDSPVQVIPQVDTFFTTAKGRLKLRELGPDLGQLIYYERPDREGPKTSDYHIFETRRPGALRLVLTLALGMRGVVRKVRHLYMIGQTRVHLDDVEGMGYFMELEVVLRPGQSQADGREIAQALISELGIHESDLLEGAYMDLLEKQA
jgi:predicted adenylyl cyclase CyaB